MSGRACLAASLVFLYGCTGSGSSNAQAHAVAPVTSAPPHAPPPPPPAPPAPVASHSTLLAGAAAVDVTPPVGVPLAGFGGGARRQLPPNFSPTSYDHFLEPSTGVRDPIMARALFLSDGKTPVAFVTIDAIATTNEIVTSVWTKAHALGSTVPQENLMVCASHTHSGPGCLTRLLFWELLATDAYADPVFEAFTDGIARALVAAEKAAVPAVVGVGSTNVTNATRNRRAGVSPYVTSTSIDPEMLVLRVDRASDGVPVATLWNFAIHGTCLGTTSHVFSADIMGGANGDLATMGVGVPLFVNSGEGDIAPSFSDDAGVKAGGRLLADAVGATRAQIVTQGSLEVANTYEMLDLGQPFVDLTVQRTGSMFGPGISQQGWFQVLATIGGQTGIDVKIPPTWIEHQFRWQAIRIGRFGFASIPGEAIHTIALDVKAFGASLGFEHTFVCGLANGHMSYVVTEPEYWVGGYEGFSTLFGPHTAQVLEDAVSRQLTKVKP